MRACWVAVAVMLLGGCGLFYSPRGDETPVAGQPAQGDPEFTITTKASDNDPRPAAEKYCGKRLGYAQLVAAERSGDDDDKIIWRFVCRR